MKTRIFHLIYICFFLLLISCKETEKNKEESNNSGGDNDNNPAPIEEKDNIPPSNLSMKINEGEPDTIVNLIMLNLSAEDEGEIVAYYPSENSVSPLPEQKGWISVIPKQYYSETELFMLSEGNGNKRVYTWFKDTVGNVSEKISTSILLNEDIPISMISFPDSNLAKCIDNTIKETRDTIAQEVKELSCNFQNIQNLAGLENFTSLEYLSLLGNNLSDIRVLSSLTLLEDVRLAYNNIIDGVDGLLILNPQLIWLSGNHHAPCLHTENLTIIFESDIVIEPEFCSPYSPDPSVLINQGDSFTSSPTVRVHLFLPRNHNFSSFSLSEDTNQPPLEGNWISFDDSASSVSETDFTLSEEGGVKTLHVWFKDHSNEITESYSDDIVLLEPLLIRDIPFANVSLAQCITDQGKTYAHEITGLSCSSMKIDNLKGLESLTNLQTLWLYNNKIQDLTPLSNLTSLKVLILHRNSIKDVSPLKNLSQLTFLYLENNKIYSGVEELIGLEKLYFINLRGNNYINCSSLDVLIEKLGWRTVLEPFRCVDSIPSMTINSGNNNTVSPSVTLNLFITQDLKYTSYYASQNEGGPGSEEDWTALEATSDYPTNLDFPLNSVEGEKTIHLWLKDDSENIIKLPEEIITLLPIVPVSEIDFEDSALKECVQNTRKAYAHEIFSLSCISKEIANLTGLEFLTNLQVLDLTDNEIEDVGPLSTLVNLEVLVLWRNKLKDARPLASLINLYYLDLDENSLNQSVLSLTTLQKLKALYLRFNSDVSCSNLIDLAQSLGSGVVYSNQSC